MTPARQEAREDRFAELILLTAIVLFGAGLRWLILQPLDFPINDGGMFYQMVRDLQTNGYRLPMYTTYNFRQIPFAYPPLPFYLTGLLSDLFHFDLLSLFLYLPTVINVLTIPVVYLLAVELLGRGGRSLAAALIYALLSPAYGWLIMGGGITRAPGSLFGLLALQQAIRALKTGARPPAGLAAIFLGLAGYCHLEYLWVTTIWIAMAAFYYLRRRAIAWLIVVFSLVGMILSPYLLTILIRHGLDPFLAALNSGALNRWVSIMTLLAANLTGEFLSSPVFILACLGLIYTLVKGDYFYITWLAVTVVLNPRSMVRSFAVPLSILAAIGIENVVLAAIRQASSFEDKVPGGRKKIARPVAIAMGVVLFLVVRTGIMTTFDYAYGSSTGIMLPEADRAAMAWIRENTPSSAKVLVLSPTSSWGSNSVDEWFPVLAGRASISTVQGTEWLSQGEFDRATRIYSELSSCTARDLACLESVVAQNGLSFDYIYLPSTLQPGDPKFRPIPRIERDMLDSTEYELVYRSGSLCLFRTR